MTKKDFKLYGSLILYALLPSVYLLIRMQIVTVNGVDINVMGLTTRLLNNRAYKSYKSIL